MVQEQEEPTEVTDLHWTNNFLSIRYLDNTCGMVVWFAHAALGSEVGGSKWLCVDFVFSPLACVGVSLDNQYTSQKHEFRLIEYSKLSKGVNASVNGCLSIS